MIGIAAAPGSVLVRDKFTTDRQLQAVPFRKIYDPEGDNTLGKCSTTLLSWGIKEPNADTTR